MTDRVLIDEANGVYRIGKRYEAEDGTPVFPVEGRYYMSSTEDMARVAGVSVSLIRKIARREAQAEGRVYGDNRVTKNTMSYAALRKDRDAWRAAYDRMKDAYDEIKGGGS